jgi:poly(3-hydroxybutyrate) depolymerase
MRPFGLICLSLLFLVDGVARASFCEELPKGTVVERVVCKAKPDQTYALYVPRDYSPERRWPLIAAFDPAARGRVAVEHFKEAAELLGYIVCASNNSRNGPWAPTAQAAEAMLNDVTERFAVDDKRVYLAGFSGGARAASKMAFLLEGRVAGVVACGAGLGTGMSASSSLPFIFYATVGTEDFNYPELKELDRSLEGAGVVHRIVVFEGGHSWAPLPALVRAVEWLDLQAMKSGRKQKDQAFIDRLLNQAAEQATANESRGNLYEAYLDFSAIPADFKGLTEVGEFEKKAAVLRETKSVKQAIKLDRDQEAEQRRKASELFGLRARLGNPGGVSELPEDATRESTPAPVPLAEGPQAARQTSESDLKDKLADLKRKSDAKDDSPQRRLARRILNQFTASQYERSMSLVQARRYDAAIENLSIDTELMPSNWGLIYSLACAYALKGDKKRALEALNRAVDKGFSNAAELERNPQLESLRSDEVYKRLLNRLAVAKQP